jgi:hypothetical protein
MGFEPGPHEQSRVAIFSLQTETADERNRSRSKRNKTSSTARAGPSPQKRRRRPTIKASSAESPCPGPQKSSRGLWAKAIRGAPSKCRRQKDSIAGRRRSTTSAVDRKSPPFVLEKRGRREIRAKDALTRTSMRRPVFVKPPEAWPLK